MTNERTAGLAKLARVFLREFPDDAARRLDELPVADVAQLVRSEPVRYVAPIVERLTPYHGAELLRRIPVEARRDIVAMMDPMRAIAIMSWMDEGARKTLFENLDAALARELRMMAEYPPETAGRLMDPRTVGFRPGTTVQQALSQLRAAGVHRVSDVFVTDDDARLTGTAALQLLALAPPDALVQNLAQPAVAVQAIDPQEEVLERFDRGRLSSLPVVDFEGRLIGVIRYDTLARTAQEDVAADIQAMVGVSRQERALSPVSFAVKRRLPWLEINLATAFLAAAVVGVFEGTIAQFTALAVLLPVVAGQAGNTGAQALAVTMRGLAMREIRIGQWPRVVRKEASVALLNGIAVSITTSAGVFVWSRSWGLSLVIGTSMVLSMVAAGVAGVLVPTVLTMFGQDPAQSSSIILTTVTDIVGFASFLGIATVLSGLL